jgi:3'(2'), 5'-bisphosphate nucleotidase
MATEKPMNGPAEPAVADIEARLAFAARIAEDCGRRLVAVRASGRWRDEAVLGDVGDQAADGYLQGALRAKWPDDGILSEETVDAPERLARPWTWIVDPLDGTKEYSQGRHDWAVHVGIACRERVVAGAVALPAIGRVVSGRCVAGGTAYLTGTGGEWPVQFVREKTLAERRLRLVVSRSHTPEIVARLARDLGDAEQIPCGSVGFKVAMLLFDRADAYVHKKGLKEWDTCAPEAVARACGFEVCRLDGREHRYNQADPRNDEIVVCLPELRDRILASLAQAAK